jgi:hypothetical protein
LILVTWDLVGLARSDAGVVIPSIRRATAVIHSQPGSCRGTLGRPARCCLVLNSAVCAHNPEVAGSNPPRYQ